MIGTFLTIDSTIFVEVISNNLDFLIIDREHSCFSLGRARDIINAINDNCLGFIRVTNSNPTEIQRCLELNPDGVMIPQISGLNDARQSVQACLYPPSGTRGLSPYTKPFNYNPSDLQKKISRINQETKIILLVEGSDAVQQIPDIVEELGSFIYAIYFGLYDFTSSLGLPADWDNPTVISTTKDLIKTCANKGILLGSIARTKEEISLLKSYGLEFIAYQNDVAIVTDGIPC